MLELIRDNDPTRVEKTVLMFSVVTGLEFQAQMGWIFNWGKTYFNDKYRVATMLFVIKKAWKKQAFLKAESA